MPERGRVLWWSPPVTVVLCLVLGVVIGAGTNLVNAHVSPGYFRSVMFWDSEEIPPAAVAQGAVEGCVLGLLYGLVLSITAAASARLRCPTSLMLATALRPAPIALACWALGGVAGVAFAAADPHGLRSMFVPGPGVPLTDWLLKYAWVGGSIWGAYGGAGVGTIYASIRLHRQWQAHLTADRAGFPVSSLVRPMASSESAPGTANRSAET